MIKELVLLSFLVISGCDTTTKEITEKYVMPKELSGCRVFYLESSTSKNLYAIDCPDTASTNWTERKQCGKNCTRDETYSVTTNKEQQQ